MIRRRKGSSNNGAGLHKELGFLLLLLLLSGCIKTPVCVTEKQWDCTVPVNEAWSCSSIYTNTTFDCQYTHKGE